MDRFVRLALFAAAASFAAASTARAEPVSLACSYAPGQAAQMYFSIDLATGIVTMDSGSYQATVTPSLVMWVVPYQDFGGGSYRPAANYAFDRNSGVLSASGSDFSSTAYCQRGVRPAPVLP